MSESEERFLALLEEHGQWLRATIRRRCPRDLGVEAEDIEQEIAMRLWRVVERGEILDQPAAYLRRIAATVTLDAMRRARTRQSSQHRSLAGEEGVAVPELEAPRPTPEGEAYSSQALEKVAEIVRTLPASRRAAVRLHLRGFGNREVAQLLGWTPARARNLIYRGMATLRRRLQEEGFQL